MNLCCDAVRKQLIESIRLMGFGLTPREPITPEMHAYLEACRDRISVELLTMSDAELLEITVGLVCSLCGELFT